MPAFVDSLKEKIEKLTSGKDPLSINLNNKGDSQLLSDIIHRIDGFTAALEDYQKKKQTEKQFEHIPQQQDISHKTANADLSAARGEQQDNGVPELEWKPVLESIDESTGKPSIWSTEINSEKYGRYLWITKNEHGTYDVEYDTGRSGYGSIMPISLESAGFSSLSDAKFWAQDWAEESGILQVEKISENDVALSEDGSQQQYAMGTKLECTSIVMLAEGSKAKAVATVTVNDEFVLKGIKVYDGANGLFVSMPSRKFGNKYSDVVFPITKQAREQLNSAVLGSYGKLLESGLDKLQIEKKVPLEKSASKITVSLHQTNNERTKAVGQVVIDDCIVISGVKVNHGTNADGIEKDFVGMPSYQTQTGEYNEYAHPITKECYDKVHSAVLKAYETLQKTEYKGVKLSNLGEKGAVSSKYGLNNKFAEKLMAELEKRGIPYSAKVAETTSLFVRNENKAAVNSLEKELSTAMKKSKAAEAPYVTVEPFSNVDFAKIGLEREKRYTIPEFNKALENADKLYTADENNSFRVDSFTVTLHIGENNYDYRPMLGAEYGTLSAIMDDISLGNSSNLSITTQEKELVAEIERNAQKPKVNDMHDTPATAVDEVVPNTTDNLEKEPSAAMKNKTQQPKQEQKPAHSKSKSR